MIFDNAEADIPCDADVCIIGAGPVGLALAFKCASQGLSVVILESGRSDDGGDGQTGLGVVEVSTPYHADTKLTTHRGIGGTSRVWGGRCVELDDIDFERRDFVPFSGWPIPHAEIAVHYQEALAFLGCGLDEGILPGTREHEKNEVVTDLLERWSMEPDLRRLHGDRLRASRDIKAYTGTTVTMIRLDAKGQDVTGLIVESRERRFEVKAKTYILAGGGLENARLLLATQRHWPQKFGGPEGALGRFYCGHLTGYLAAIRLKHPGLAKLLWYERSRDGSHIRRRLALSHDAQRQYGLLNTVFWLDSFSVADPAHGSGALSMLYMGLALFGLYPRLGSGLAPSPTEAGSRNYRRHLSNVRRDPKLAKGALHVLSQLVRKRLGQKVFALANPGNHYLLRYHAEQVPDAENRAVLSDQQHGAALPRLRVDFRFQPQDIESVVRSHDIVDQWLQREGIGRLDYLVAPEKRSQVVLDQALDGYHQVGLTRMSDEPKDGVVDRNCRVHDVTNLFVAGSSVFPTAGQANPTLPAVALALRLGNYLGRAMAGVRVG